MEEQVWKKITDLFRTAWTALREHKPHTKEYLRRLGGAKTAEVSAGIIAEMLCEASVIFKADIASHLRNPEDIVEFYHYCRDDRTWQNTRSMCLFASACGPVKEQDGHRVSD